MQSQWMTWLVLILAAGRQVSCERLGNTTVTASRLKDRGFILSQQKAQQFFKGTTPAPISNEQDLRNECCDEGCHYEERCEYSEEHGWDGVDALFCEVSIREGKTCRCQARAGWWYECTGKLENCRPPCRRGYEFWCGSGRNCVNSNYMCDSDNDCGNWNDEAGCRITTKNSKYDIIRGTRLQGGSTYWGNVYVLGRPVCDDGWDYNDAKVLCRTLGFSPSYTQPVAWQGSRYGNVGTAFRMDDVNCNGYESYIGECPHVTSNNCGTGEGAGVTCVDASTLQLIGGPTEFEGAVIMINEPVCYDGWNLNSAQVVCNQKFKDRFAKRQLKIAPVFSTSSESWSSSTSVRNVNCRGTEANLAQCSLDAHQNCNSKHVVRVKCAKCTPDHLISILKSIKPGTNRAKTYESVSAASAKLAAECWHWDCSYKQKDKRYPEFCEIKSFFDRALVYLSTPDNEVVKLQTKFDYGDLLNHVFMKQSFADLQHQIFGIGDKIDSFQRKLGSYFTDVASFDRRKAELGLQTWKSAWESKKLEIEQQGAKLEGQLKDVYILAFTCVGAELVEDAVELAIYVANMANPVGWLVGGAKSALDVKDAMKKLMKARSALARLGRAMSVQLPKMKKIADRIHQKEKLLTSKFASMIKLVSNPTPFTEEEAFNFLDSYRSFSTSVTATDIVEYHSIVSVLVSTACDAIHNADTVAGATVELVAAALGSCPEIKPTVEVLTSLYQSSLAAQKNLVGSLAQIARARVTEEKAKSLSEILGSNLEQEIRRKVAMLDSLFFLQIHKETLVKEACDYVTYVNHGQEQEVCTRLLQNPSLDTAELISFNYKRDMCDCSNCIGFDKILPIPAALNNGQSLPAGTIDLTHLYNVNSSATDGWVRFQIPNRKWLLDNGWITGHENEGVPMFLQSMQFYLPSGSNTEYQYPVQTKLVLTGKSLMNGKKYEITGNDMVMKTEYLENADIQQCTHPFRNQFNIVNCPKHFKQVCVTGSPTYNGPIYPTLVGSTWKVSLYSPAILRRPSPEGLFFIKAKVRFCQKSSSTNNRSTNLNVATGSVNSPECCYDRKMYFDQVIAAKSSGDPCRPCPNAAIPRMYGFYCESCHAGYEEMVEPFGCSPCKIGEFKSHAGRERCQPCPAGTTTFITGQETCMKRKNETEKA